MPPAVDAQSLKHRTAREVPNESFQKGFGGSPTSLLEQMVSRTGHGNVCSRPASWDPSQLQDARITRNTLCLATLTSPVRPPSCPGAPGGLGEGLALLRSGRHRDNLMRLLSQIKMSCRYCFSTTLELSSLPWSLLWTSQKPRPA